MLFGFALTFIVLTGLMVGSNVGPDTNKSDVWSQYIAGIFWYFAAIHIDGTLRIVVAVYCHCPLIRRSCRLDQRFVFLEVADINEEIIGLLSTYISMLF